MLFQGFYIYVEQYVTILFLFKRKQKFIFLTIFYVTWSVYNTAEKWLFAIQIYCKNYNGTYVVAQQAKKIK